MPPAQQGPPADPQARHAPATHSSPAPHACAHEPQFAASVVVSTHASLQSMRAVGHTHARPEQLVPNGQTCPHEPQFDVSLVVSRHAPKSPPQSERPPVHAHMAAAASRQLAYVEQLDDAHAPIALATASRFPQASVVSASSTRT
jgi:hypothetical protein